MTRISSIKASQTTSKIEPVMPNSTYWQHYGLDKDPLSNTNDDISFIPSKWEEYSDILAEYCQHKNLLLAIIGVNGSGKTTFLKQFIAQLGNSMYIHKIDADPSLTSQQLIKVFAEGFKINIPQEETLEECLDAQLFEMQQHKKLCLLIIDEAHQLPLETLESLLDLVAQQSDTQMRLHVLLAGESSLVARLDSLDDSDNLVQTLMLDGFSLEETELYLQHRLNAAGYSGDILFSPSAVARIYRLSSGIPSRINRLAQRMLCNAIATPTKEPSLLTAKQIKLIGAILLLLILGGAALLLSYLNSKPFHVKAKLPTVVQKIPVLQQAPDALPAAPINTSDSVLAVNKQPEQSSMVSMHQAEAMLLSGAGVVSDNNKAPIKVIVKPAASVASASAPTPEQLAQVQAGPANKKEVAPAKDTATSDKTQIEQAIPASNKNSEIIVIGQDNSISTEPEKELGQVNSQSAQAITPAENQKPAILAQTKAIEIKENTQEATNSGNAEPAKASLVEPEKIAAGQYSLQIVGSHQMETINKFLAESKLKKNYYILRTAYQGQDWYILLYGKYPSTQAAQKAVNHLPAIAQQLKPWPRKLSALQNAEIIN